MNIEETYGGSSKKDDLDPEAKTAAVPVPVAKAKVKTEAKGDLTPVSFPKGDDKGEAPKITETPATKKPVEEQKSDATHSKTEQARMTRKGAAREEVRRKLPGELRQILFDQDVSANPKMNYRTPVTAFLQKYYETFMRMDIKRLAEMVEVVIRGGFTLEEKAAVHKDLTYEQTKLIEVSTPEEMGAWQDSTLRELAFYQKLMVELDLQQQNQLLRAIEQRLAG